MNEWCRLWERGLIYILKKKKSATNPRVVFFLHAHIQDNPHTPKKKNQLIYKTWRFLFFKSQINLEIPTHWSAPYPHTNSTIVDQCKVMYECQYMEMCPLINDAVNHGHSRKVDQGTVPCPLTVRRTVKDHLTPLCHCSIYIFTTDQTDLPKW